MDGHQRGMRTADVTTVFAEYEAFLGRALPQAEERQARDPAPLRPVAPFPIAVEEALCRRLAERLGLDFAHARLDRSAHPFTGGTPSHVRITSRYDEADFTQAVLALVHETGYGAGRARSATGPGIASRSVRWPAWRRTRASR